VNLRNVGGKAEGVNVMQRGSGEFAGMTIEA
jgi:hypothetical protein